MPEMWGPLVAALDCWRKCVSVIIWSCLGVVALKSNMIFLPNKLLSRKMYSFELGLWTDTNICSAFKQLLLNQTFCYGNLPDLGASKVFPLVVPSRPVMNGNARASDKPCNTCYHISCDQHANCLIMFILTLTWYYYSII